MRSIVLVLLVGVIACGAAWAQSTAQISGSVTDQSGAVLPGVEVTATQTGTGLIRNVVTNETGSFVLANLPVGPYRLEAGLPGFRTYVRTGIVLQVSGNPVINVVLEVGQVAETIEVQADAALVETRSTGVGQLIDNVRVLELPLNARQVTELIILSGAAVGGGALATNRVYPTDVISVGGGLSDGLTFLLDGGTHNEVYANLNMPLPFPDALQEFKVETSAVPAQYGQHSAGVVNAVTKSGTNAFHGSLFEFVRNKVFNARNTFAQRRDGLKRNQFGGVVGGPIVRNKLFFFAGHQVTLARSEPTDNIAFVPTPAMLAGDWTAITGPECNRGRQITLRAPFSNNRINPAAFSTPALNLMKRLPTPTDPCGQVKFGQRTKLDEHILVGRVDYQRSAKHTLFGRYELVRMDSPNNFDGSNQLSVNQPDYDRRAHSVVLGDTYTFGSNLVSSFRGTLLRAVNDKFLETDFFTLSDLGVKSPYYPQGWGKMAIISVSGAFNINSAQSTPGVTNMTIYQLAEDISWIQAAHQIGFGANFIHSNMNYSAGTWSPGQFAFNATNTGLSLGDFMLGRPNQWSQSNIGTQYYRQNYIGAYLQDTWKANSRITVNAGVRWEPYVPAYDKFGKIAHFDKKWFDQGASSTVFSKAPAGILFTGDSGLPDTKSLSSHHWARFAPRLGVAWDPNGNGLMTVRAAYGLFFDYPHFNHHGGLRDTPPRGSRITLANPIGGFEDPWSGYPGGNPFPLTIKPDMTFPTAGVYTIFPLDRKKPYINQWNLTVQKQFGADWLAAGNYIGNSVIHVLDREEANPAIYDPRPSCVIEGRTYTPCSQVGNTNQRRLLYLQDANKGQYFSNIIRADDGGTRSYNALALSLQRRRARGITVQANYTWSHCIDDGMTDVIQTNGNRIPERRGANRGDCELDRRHNFNMSTVYETPQFSSPTLRLLGAGWRVSGIVRVLSGARLTVSSGLDNAFSGTTDQRPNQVLASPYAINKSTELWLNPSAFVQPAHGTYGNVGRSGVVGPGSIRIDMGLTRAFRITESQSLEFRAEAFNLPNHVNPGNPSLILTDSNFGRILSAAEPRVMQMALKYVF